MNSKSFEFKANSLEHKNLSHSITDIILSSDGKFITIECLMIEKQSVIIIVDSIENIIFETTIEIIESREFDLLWIVPSADPGNILL